jgi:hypothetical protein
LKIKALSNKAPSAKIEYRVLKPLCLGKKHALFELIEVLK